MSPPSALSPTRGKLGEQVKGGENFPGIKVTWLELKCIGIHRTRFVDLG